MASSYHPKGGWVVSNCRPKWGWVVSNCHPKWGWVGLELDYQEMPESNLSISYKRPNIDFYTMCILRATVTLYGVQNVMICYENTTHQTCAVETT
jgi:hypothetical protein